ncbi:MAG: HAD family hydrolase [Sphingomonadaceae bacterium]
MTGSIAPHELEHLLDRWPGIRCLSLDCFDTLLWRDVHAPRDLFHALPGTSIIQRIHAESQARLSTASKGRGNEVKIAEIYAQLLPNGKKQQIDKAVDAELLNEARHCFGFVPIVRIMQKAKQRGLKVIIVSDTYLNANQLRNLIANAAGNDVAGLIDDIYCSCHYGKAKAQGLYGQVLRKLKLPPEAILHIGDNPVADVKGVQPFGVNTVHLQQFCEATDHRLRLESSIDGIIHPIASETASRILPHRATISLLEPHVDDPAERLGLSVLGPVFHGFQGWLQAEAADLAKHNGGNVHWLFMMRDGHLPMLLHAQARPEIEGHAIEISRFTASAASLIDDAALSAFLEREPGTRAEVLGRQLLIPSEQINAICHGLDPNEARAALLQELKAGPRRKAIIRASRAFADRMVEHVKQIVQPAPGDTLMMIDLGYNGSVQNRIDALLRERLGVHVAGRYLLLREVTCPGLDKRGFIDGRNYDPFALEAMCSNVAVIEQLATSKNGSVIDYEIDGTPIRRSSDIVSAQSAVRERVQAGCLQFGLKSGSASIRSSSDSDAELWRRGAANVMMRFMFLPTSDELAVIDAFEHDVNLGTAETTGLFDKAHSHRALRERGLFYMNSSERMYLPAELQGQGMATRLSLLTQRRFGLPLTFTDNIDATIELPVIFADHNEAITQLISASITHDGYFLAAIPVGAARYSIALHFGAILDWFQLESVTFHKVAEFLSTVPEELRRRWAGTPQLDGITEVGPRLMHCDCESGFVMVQPPQVETDDPLLLACVFRPLVVRDTEQPTQAGDVGCEKAKFARQEFHA